MEHNPDRICVWPGYFDAKTSRRGGRRVPAIHPFSSPTSKACILQLVKSASRKSSVRKAHRTLSDRTAKKADCGSAVQVLSNPLVPIQRKKFSNSSAANGVKCKRIARLQKRNSKPQDHEQETDEHVHNARQDNAHKVVREVVSRSAVSRNSPNSIKTDQRDILLYGTSISRHSCSS